MAGPPKPLKQKKEELFQRLQTAVILGSCVVIAFLVFIYHIKSSQTRTYQNIQTYPPLAPLPPEPSSPPPSYPSPPPLKNGINLQVEMEEKRLLGSIGGFDAMHHQETQRLGDLFTRKSIFTGNGAGKEALLLTEAQWKAMDLLAARTNDKRTMNREAAAKKAHEQSLITKDGMWYFSGGMKDGQIVADKRGKPFGWDADAVDMCFYSDQRAVDFYEPLNGTWIFSRKTLPIYSYFDCWADGVATNILMPHYNCRDGQQAQQCQRMRYQPSACATASLNPVKLISYLQDRTMWFFGDYGSKQQYLALKCTLWAYRQRPIDDELKTPGFDFAEGWLFDNNVRVVYIHAGMNSVPPAPVVKKDNGKNKGVKCKKGDKKCIAKNARLSPPPQSPPPPAHGLTGDFMAAHGLTHTAGMDVVADMRGMPGVAVEHLTLEEQVERYLPDFKPWDVMVANVGAEFSEARIYQRNLLNFLKLYDDKKDVLPVILWRETPAQHHDPALYKGGDVLSPIHRDFLAPPPPRDVGNKPLSTNEQKHLAYVRAHPKELGAPTEAEHAHVKHMAESVMCKDVPFPILREHNWRNDLANRLVETAGIPVLRIWESSTKRSDWYSPYCKGRSCAKWGPCVHYCNPGAVTYWNELLLTMMESRPIHNALNARLPQPPAPPAYPGLPPVPPGVQVVESTTLEPEDAWQLDSQAAIPDELKANVLGFSPPPSPPQTSMLQLLSGEALVTPPSPPHNGMTPAGMTLSGHGINVSPPPPSPQFEGWRPPSPPLPPPLQFQSPPPPPSPVYKADQSALDAMIMDPETIKEHMMGHVKGEESSYKAQHVGMSPGARVKEEAFKFAAGLANPGAADPNVAQVDADPVLAGDAPEPVDLTQGVATAELKLYETAPADTVAEQQPVKEKSYFTPDVARRAVAYSAKDGVMEKSGSLGARSQELITRTSGELLRLGNDAARDGRYLTPDAPPVPGGRGQSHLHMPPSPPPVPVKTGAYVSSKPASDALDILDGVNLAGEAQSADGGGGAAGGDDAGASEPEGGGVGEVKVSEAGEAVVDKMQSEHLSFEAAMKNTEQAIADMTDPTQAVTADDVSESVTDVLQPGGGGGGDGGDGGGDSASGDGSELAAASQEE